MMKHDLTRIDGAGEVDIRPKPDERWKKTM
jgi:hypothetical protein